VPCRARGVCLDLPDVLARAHMGELHPRRESSAARPNS